MNISVHDRTPDLIIRGGRVIDGTGNPAYFADIAINSDRIIEIGQLSSVTAKEEIDAKGRIVCPGFIDAHSHTDGTIRMNPTAQSTIRQGITTEVVGNCGSSPAPISKHSLMSGTSTLFEDCEENEVTFARYLEELEEMGISCNFAHLLGHNTLRSAAGVIGSEVRPDELRLMKRYIDEAMEAGAIGMSSGLEFDPGRISHPHEIEALVMHLKKHDGIYVSHIRNRSFDILPALDEFMNVIRQSEVRGQVSHLNIRYNTGAPEDGFARCVQMIEQVRAQGFDVLADMTPLNYGTGSPTAILPHWITELDAKKAIVALSDSNVRKRLRTECDRYWRFIHRGEWDRVMVQKNPAFPEVNGMWFPQIAELFKKDEWDCYFDLLLGALEQTGRLGGMSFVGRLFTDEHMKETIAHPLYMLGVDGSSTTADGELAKTSAFPLHYMGMIHYITHHVRTVHTLTLEEAIRKMTSMAASHFRIKDRGHLRAGCFADVVVFDYNELDDEATIANPCRYVKGVGDVLVNGIRVVKESNHTGARPGRVLRA